jgi:hypothetical protein
MLFREFIKSFYIGRSGFNTGPIRAARHENAAGLPRLIKSLRVYSGPKAAGCNKTRMRVPGKDPERHEEMDFQRRGTRGMACINTAHFKTNQIELNFVLTRVGPRPFIAAAYSGPINNLYGRIVCR